MMAGTVLEICWDSGALIKVILRPSLFRAVVFSPPESARIDSVA